MTIAKGPFHHTHQSRALSQVMQARLMNRVSTHQAPTWYLALLNLEKYLETLASRKMS